MDRSFEPLSEGERRWIRDQLVQAGEFARQFDPEARDSQPSLESLDRAFANYLAANSDSPDGNAVTLAIGAALGTKLVDDLGFEWVIGTDDFGTDLAVLARPGRGDVAIYPADFVAKRYERRQAPFIVDAVAEIQEHLRDIASEWDAAEHGAPPGTAGPGAFP